MSDDQPSELPAVESGAVETPWEDLRAGALAEYERVSTIAHSWSSVIPKAINFYFDNAKVAQDKTE